MMDYVRDSTAHIFVDELKSTLKIIGEDFHHLARVLRIKSGEIVTAAHKGHVREYKVDQVTKEHLDLCATREVEELYEPSVEIAVGLFKIDRLEWGIQKAVEAGATKIVIGASKHSSVSLSSAQSEKFLKRIASISLNAAMQSRRSQLVEIEVVNNLIEYCIRQSKPLIVCDPSGGGTVINDGILVIGPEGGLSKQELNILSENGSLWSISPYILRAETALACAPALYLQAKNPRLGSDV